MRSATILIASAFFLVATAAAAQEGTPPPEEERRGASFGLFAGGLVLPGADVNAVAAGAMVNLVTPKRGWEPRIFAIGYRVEDEHTKTLGGAAVFHETFWFGGIYGLGFGSGLGYASFEKKKGGGWDDKSAQLIVYAAPVILRFGDRTKLELGLNAGATRFFAHDVRPFGYLYAGVVF
jgi:hypothetical protein